MLFGEEVGAVVSNIGKLLKDAVSAFKVDQTKAIELEHTIENARLNRRLPRDTKTVCLNVQ
jgi:hypothetical protein